MRLRRLILLLLLTACAVAAYSGCRTALRRTAFWRHSQRADVYAADVVYIAREWYPADVYLVRFQDAGSVEPELERRLGDLASAQALKVLVGAQGSGATRNRYWVYEGRQATIIELGQIHWSLLAPLTAVVDVTGTCGPQCGSIGSLTTHRAGRAWRVSSYKQDVGI